jgi:4-amino-4-deoxy-L-arabinose transferase-like glycosyltransferase
VTGQRPGRVPRSLLAPRFLLNAFLWLAPVFFLFWVYREGLQCWFIADDFAWLGLLRQYHSPGDLLSILFAPAAQGTIRPWSERGFFLLFESLFGLDDLPFRIAAFTVMAANLLLVAWLARRLTRSALAGCIAAVIWSANTALVTAMSWSSSFNQVLCPFFLLSALALSIRFAETGRRAFWWGQLLVFVLGFGALEINVIYPALAAAWVLFVAPPDRRRKLLLSLIPLFALSVIYYAIHRVVAPLPTAGPYALHFDARILKTLALYGKWSLLPVDWVRFGHSPLLGKAVLWCGIAAILILFVSEARQRRTTALFFAAWYLAALAPVLPLPDHHTDYYLTTPLIGLALLAAWGFHTAWDRVAQGPARQAWRAASIVAILAYLTGMVPVSRSATHWWRERTASVRGVVLGVVAAHESHPGKAILLDGVTPSLYTDSIGQGALYAANADFVYLTPGSEQNLQAAPDLVDLQKTVLDPAVALHALEAGQVVVYSVAGDHLRNITEGYERSAPVRFPFSNAKGDPLPARIDAGNPLYSWLLGPAWMPSESGVRWMPGQATLRMAGPKAGDRLLLEGFFPVEQLKQAPRHLLVTADGMPLGNTEISDPESTFQRLFDIPSSVVGRDVVNIEIRVNPVTRRDGQDYGVVFGKIAYRPRL